ncbi:DedA family protein [Streptomyces sp. NPDC002092]
MARTGQRAGGQERMRDPRLEREPRSQPWWQGTSSLTARAGSWAVGCSQAAQGVASRSAAWKRAETLMTRHGGRAVLMARFMPVVRTLAPHFAGATRLPYRRIAPYSVLAAFLWATAEVGAGYAAATSLQRVLTIGGPILALLALTAVGGALLWRSAASLVHHSDN